MQVPKVLQYKGLRVSSGKSTVSKPPVARLSSPSANLLKIPETHGLGDFFFVRICLFLPLKAVKVWGYLEVFEVTELLSGY